jgi:hypothetical protein
VQERWLNASIVRDNGARTVSEGGGAQAAESIGDELNTPEADGFSGGEGSQSGWNHRNSVEGEHAAKPLPVMPTINVFYTGKI